MWKDKRVFVSGGSGVIGVALVKKLYEKGATIFVGDLKPRPQDWPKIIRYRQGDLNYISKLELNEFAPEYFFHLAATFERSTETFDFWQENYHHNINLSHYLMDCLKDSQALKKVIFASSYLIYDSSLYSFSSPANSAVRLKETDPINPRNLCGAAKLVHEVELNFLTGFKEAGFQMVCARIFRSYGKNSRDIISRWVRALLNNLELTVYKKEGLFDYIYAEEVAEGLVKLAESQTTGIVNLGNDNARRVEEVLNELKKYFSNVNINYSDIAIPYEASQANMDEFLKITGWKPLKQIEDSIPEIIEFEKINLGNNIIKDENNILVTSISKKAPLLKVIIEAKNKLGNIEKVFGADSNKNCIGKFFVDSFWKMPYLSELNIEDFIEYCNTNQITRIIPTRDGELSFFASNREKFEQNGIIVMISPLQSIEICLDKLLFYQTLKKMSFPAISTSLAMDESMGDSFVVKERFGAGSRTIGLNLTKSQAFNHAIKLKAPVFQPYIYGQEVSVDLYVDMKGKTKGIITRTRDLIIDGESQITTTVKNPELEKLCSDLAEALNLYGHIVFQVLIDPNNCFHIIECNSRFGGASTLSIAAGLDSFYWFLLESAGVDITEYPFIRTKEEKRLVRHAEDMIL